MSNMSEDQLMSANTFDVYKIREDFPILKEEVHNKPLVYLDSAATAQKPRAVIDAISGHHSLHASNVHRGVHYLSERATQAYESARKRIKGFINAQHEREIIFVRGTTEAINLVAASFGSQNLGPGDEVLISAMEHHSNIVPWQLICEKQGAVLKVIPINDDGELILEEYEKLLNKKTKLVAIVHISNSLGTINPVHTLIEKAHARQIPVLVDGAQAAAHQAVDVQALDCDFYAFSGHKLFGPTGIGVLYGKKEWLENMPPYQGGGDMIRTVSFEKTTFNDLPYKFEAGTPNIAGVIGLGAAIDYLNAVGMDKIEAYEQDLMQYATRALKQLPGLRLIGTAKAKAAILSFVLEGIHPHDIGTVLDLDGVAIRAGHHCTMPVMERYKVPATARASLAFYNTREEIDILVEAIKKAQEMFK